MSEAIMVPYRQNKVDKLLTLLHIFMALITTFAFRVLDFSWFLSVLLSLTGILLFVYYTFPWVWLFAAYFEIFRNIEIDFPVIIFYIGFVLTILYTILLIVLEQKIKTRL